MNSTTDRQLNIIALTHRRPFPPDRGDRIRSFHLLTRMAERHKVWLLAVDDAPMDLVAAPTVELCCQDHHVCALSPARRLFGAGVSLLQNRPLTLGWFHHPDIRRKLKQWNAEHHFDAAFVYSSSMAPYWMRENRRTGLPGVIDFIDVDSEKWRQYAEHTPIPKKWIYQREHTQLAKFERLVVQQAAHSAFVSEAEVETFARISPGLKTVSLGNGVDGGFYERPELARRSDPPRLAFVGNMGYQANVDAAQWFADEVFPRLREWRSDLAFDIVGSNPSAEVKLLDQREGIRVTGWVEDVRPYLWEATVGVAPLRIAQGTQNKVLEAMAALLPVVSTSMASRGLAASRGDHIIVQDDPAGFADAVRRLIENPDLARSQGQAALAFIQRDHSWDGAANYLCDLLEDAAARRVRS